jgi:hypothetical protein
LRSFVQHWRLLSAFGVCVAAMNRCLYMAIARIPLGAATGRADWTSGCYGGHLCSRCGNWYHLVRPQNIVSSVCLIWFSTPSLVA